MNQRHTDVPQGWGQTCLGRTVQHVGAWVWALGLGVGLGVGLGLVVTPLCAQNTPAPVRILVGAPAGGTTDTMARSLAQALTQQWQRVVLVENRTGAGGNVAAEAVARAAPDGLTLLMSFTSHAINASLYPHPRSWWPTPPWRPTPCPSSLPWPRRNRAN